MSAKKRASASATSEPQVAASAAAATATAAPPAGAAASTAAAAVTAAGAGAGAQAALSSSTIYQSGGTLTLQLILALLRPFAASAEYLTEHTLREVFVPISKIVYEHLRRLTDEELKKVLVLVPVQIVL